ncbi:NAD-dependent epimerase/dehydratase family protein [Microbacterium sp. M1A1_1b]
MTASTALVVGGGGFLGRAVVRALVAAGTDVVVPRVRWSVTADAAADLVDAIRSMRAGGRPWSLVWCAGTGIVATGADAFAAEAELLERVLDPVATAPAAAGAPGAVFFASSAGAAYAGSIGVPFDETSEPRPLAPYGSSRLLAEQRFRDWAEAVGARALIGRIANLYGPGANLGKPQGLVSQLALAHVEGRPSSLYVPLDTTRDYLFIDDAAAMVVDALDRVRAEPGAPVTKIFASQQGRTIREVLDAVGAAVGEDLDVRSGEDPSASAQGRDLRFRSVVLPEVDDRLLTPFDAGVRRTVDDVRRTVDVQRTVDDVRHAARADGHPPAGPVPPHRGDLSR